MRANRMAEIETGKEEVWQEFLTQGRSTLFYFYFVYIAQLGKEDCTIW